MSDFSKFIKKILEKNDMTIYGLSKQTGIERTSLNRMVNSKRIPDYCTFEKICECLRMAPADRCILEELFWKEKLGIKVYSQRRKIKSMLNSLHLSGYSNKVNGRLNCYDAVNDIPEMYGQRPDNTLKFDKVKKNINAMVKDVIHSDLEKIIYTNISASYSTLFNEIELLCEMYDNKLELNQYLILTTNPDNYRNPTYNLEVLCSVFPMIFFRNIVYKPFYAYGDCLQDDDYNDVFPYYLISSNEMLLISDSMDDCIKVTDIEHINAYIRQIKNKEKNMYHFWESCDGEKEGLFRYIDKAKDMGIVRYSYEFYPCLIPYSKLEELSSVIEEYNAQAILEPWKQLEESRQLYRKNEGDVPYTNICSEDGIEYFARTGKVESQAAMYFPVMSVERRIDVLKKIISDNKNDIIRVQINSDRLYNDKMVSVESYEKGLLISLYMENEYKIIAVKESSICQSIIDFFSSLDEMKEIKGIDESNMIIEKYIKKLEDGEYD